MNTNRAITIEEIKQSAVSEITVEKTELDAIDGYETVERVTVSLEIGASVFFNIHSRFYTNPNEWSFYVDDKSFKLITANDLTLNKDEVLEIAINGFDSLLYNALQNHRAEYTTAIKTYEAARLPK